MKDKISVTLERKPASLTTTGGHYRIVKLVGALHFEFANRTKGRVGDAIGEPLAQEIVDSRNHHVTVVPAPSSNER